MVLAAMEKKIERKEAREEITHDDDDDDDGKVGRLSTDTLKYFQRVEQVLDDNVFEDDEHKEAFMRNVFQQIETDGTHLARHSNKSSRIIEKIIPYLNDDLYEKFVLLIREEIEMLSQDRFSSHVIETLCKSVTSHLENANVQEVFVSFCKVIRKHCSVLIRDTYGSHVLSTVLQVLSGVKVPEVVTKSQASRKAKKKKGCCKLKPVENANSEPVISEVPRIFKKCFKKYVQVIQEDINFGELLCHRNASPVLQVMLLATAKVSLSNHQIIYSAIVSRGKVLDLPESGCGIEDDDEFVYRLPVVFTDDVGSHLFEALIKSADDAQLDELGEKCFRRCILSLCIHPLGNYLAQTYLRSMRNTQHVEFFVGRLLKYLEDILAAGSMGCVVRLAELITKHEKVEYQKKYITALSDALHIPETTKGKPLSKLVICMKTYEILYKTTDKETPDDAKKEQSDGEPKETDEGDEVIMKRKITNDDIDYHGCCILQNVLSFKKCRQVVESVLELSTEELKLISCNPHGSFTIEKFCLSEHIPSKSKVALGELLITSTYELACDKFGSRVIDCIFKAMDDAMQEKFKYILRENKSRLETNLYGRIVLYNSGVKQHVDKMREIQDKLQKKRKELFGDIIDEKKDANPKDSPKDEFVPVKKKKKDDRATRYQKQLEALGISIAENKEESTNDMTIEEEKPVDTPQSDETPDDLCDVLQAIEASVEYSGKKVKKLKRLR